MADLFPPYVVHETSELVRKVAQLKEAYAIPAEDPKRLGARLHVAFERSTLAQAACLGSVTQFMWAAHILSGNPDQSILENPKLIYQGLNRPFLVIKNNYWYTADRMYAYYLDLEVDYLWKRGQTTWGQRPQSALFVVYIHLSPGDAELDRLQDVVGGRKLHGRIYGWEWVEVDPATGAPENAEGRFLKQFKPPPE